MRTSHLSRSRLVVFVFLLAAVGCSKGYQIAPVSGRVELDHHPLAHATVAFAPQAGKDFPTSTGTTDEQGNFTLVVNDSSHSPGAVVGEHKVSISLDARNQDKKIAIKHMRHTELLPSKYSHESTLKFTVAAGGTTQANFLDLKSDDSTKSAAPSKKIH